MLPALFLALACSGGSDKAEDADDTAGTDASGLPAIWTEHYHVESDIRAGSYHFEERYWARRVVNPEGAVIDEEFIAEADGTETLTHLEVDADAGTFTLTINEGEYTGEGSFTAGEAWAWTAWESLSTAADGSFVVSEDQLTDTGILAAKVGYSVQGEEEWTLDEVLTLVDEAEWQAGVDALGR